MEIAAKNLELRMKNGELGEQIREWAKSNDWFSLGLLTNQLKFHRLFGGHLKSIAITTESKGRQLAAAQIAEKHDMILRLCIRIDSLCRQGCTNEEELTQAELLRDKAIAAAAELAEVIELLRSKPEILSTKSETNPKSQNLKSQEHTEKDLTPKACGSTETRDEWITFAEAAEIIGVAKGTVSKWAEQGRFVDNEQKGQKRRLSKVSVLMVKQQLEDDSLKKDVKELREDIVRIK